MCLNMLSNPTLPINGKQRQRGSMLVIALFVIVVFALLGLTMTRLLSSSSESVIFEVLGQRALNAARSGLEFCLAAEYPVDQGVIAAQPCADPTTDSFPDIPGLENCSYRVEPAEDITVTDGAVSYTYTKFTSTGSCQAGAIITSRTVYVDALVPN